MDGNRFESVNLILAEANWQIRESLKSRLFHEGFRNVFATDRVERVRAAIAAVDLDLIIADTDLPDGDVCDLFYAIRHHQLGHNPFIAIIATSPVAHSDLVHRVIDSGADDLLVKPMSTDHLVQRIRQLVSGRRPFLVTSSYIGPDRRKTQRETSQTPVVDVPNPLKAKVTEGMSSESIQDAITTAAVAINEQRIGRHAAEITALVTRVVDAHARGRSADERRPDLGRLLYVAEDIERRLSGTRYDHVSELCSSLRRVTGSLERAGDTPDTTDIQLLPELAAAVEAAFRLGEEAAQVSHDISWSVKRMGTK
jgi:DNA-binding response OmpR family regulator